MTVHYKGPDTDDKEVIVSDDVVYYTEESAKSVEESNKAAESNPGGSNAKGTTNILQTITLSEEK